MARGNFKARWRRGLEDVSKQGVEAKGATDERLLKRFEKNEGEQVKTCLLALFASQAAKDELRRIMQALTVPGRGRITYQAIADAIAPGAVFLSDAPSKDRVEYFVDGTSASPDQIEDVLEYARFVVAWWETAESKRRGVVAALKNASFPIVEGYQAAIEASDPADFKKRMNVASADRRRRFFYEEMFQSMSGDVPAMKAFAGNVIGYPDHTSARFLMFRHTSRKRRIYRSVYTFELDEFPISATAGGQDSQDNLFSVDFAVEGRGAGEPIRSAGFVITQQENAYMIGNIGGQGLHMSAIPRQQFRTRRDMLHCLTMSVDIGGDIENSPVVSRALLVRITPQLEAAIADMEKRGESVAATETEEVTAAKFFSGDRKFLRRLANNVEQELAEPIRLIDGALVENYMAFLQKLAPAIATIVEAPDGIAHRLFTPPRLKGASALALTPRNGEEFDG